LPVCSGAGLFRLTLLCLPIIGWIILLLILLVRHPQVVVVDSRKRPI
jgi:hypothetical protein